MTQQSKQDTRLLLAALGKRASGDVRSWASFVAHTEYLWQDSALVTDADAWQSLWFEMEIINGLALAEWEELGWPADGLQSWADDYQQDASELVAELLTLLR
ncbi:hypothetical protein [Pantoea sp. B65]|uniref:hypothetical protein n=1 Tax=Pantoea sp. B65 TaxID=2813359 RepID=UPI0039B54B3C